MANEERNAVSPKTKVGSVVNPISTTTTETKGAGSCLVFEADYELMILPIRQFSECLLAYAIEKTDQNRFGRIIDAKIAISKNSRTDDPLDRLDTLLILPNDTKLASDNVRKRVLHMSENFTLTAEGFKFIENLFPNVNKNEINVTRTDANLRKIDPSNYRRPRYNDMRVVVKIPFKYVLDKLLHKKDNEIYEILSVNAGARVIQLGRTTKDKESAIYNKLHPRRPHGGGRY